MVGIVLFSVLPACLVYLVATVDDLIYFFDIPPPLNNKIIFRTNQEMKLIITKVWKNKHQYELTGSAFSYIELHTYYYASTNLELNITVQIKKTVIDPYL